MPRMTYFPPNGSVLLSGPATGDRGDTLSLTLRPVALDAPEVTLEIQHPDGRIDQAIVSLAGVETSFDLAIERAGAYRVRATSHPSNLLWVEGV